MVMMSEVGGSRRSIILKIPLLHPRFYQDFYHKSFRQTPREIQCHHHHPTPNHPEALFLGWGSGVRGGGDVGRQVLGYLAKPIQTPMAQGRSTKLISTIKWVRTSRLSTKISLSLLTFRKVVTSEPLIRKTSI